MISLFKKPANHKKEVAQTFVEFALVFPIILMITYGIIELGRMVFIYASVTNGAREGSRYGSAAGVGDNSIVQYADCAGIKDAVRHTAFLITVPDSNINISYEISPSAGWSTTCATVQSDPSIVQLGDRVLVQVAVQYEPIIGNFLGIHGFTINAANARTILKDVKIQK